MRCFRDAQHDTIADRRDSDVKNFNGWRSLPIVNSGGFARCVAFVRFVCGVCAARVRRLCGRVRLCAVVCGCVRLCAAKFAVTNWNDEQTYDLCRVGERRRCSLLTYIAT